MLVSGSPPKTLFRSSEQKEALLQGATEGSQGIPDRLPVLYIQKRCLLDHYEAICQTSSLQQTVN